MHKLVLLFPPHYEIATNSVIGQEDRVYVNRFNIGGGWVGRNIITDFLNQICEK